MAFVADSSERDKIDAVLRLPGLKFPKDKLVIGKKNFDLLMALGAIDIQRSRAGRQLFVVRRLCTLYEAVLSIYRDCPSRDINHEKFYEAALLNIPSKQREMIRYLTPESLRHVIELYRKAFVRSGWKVIHKPSKKKPAKDWVTYPAQSNAAQPNGDGGEEPTVEETTELLEPIEPIGDRVRLEKLVKEWMVAHGRQRANPPAEDTDDDDDDPLFPQMKPDETAPAYLLRVKHVVRELHEDKKMLQGIIAQKPGKGDAEGEKHDEMIERSEKRLALLEAVVDGQAKDCDVYAGIIEECDDRISLLQATIDEADEELKRLQSMNV